MAEIVEVKKKVFWKSRVLWFNVITGIIAIAQIIPSPVTMVASVVGNVILRTMTNAPLTTKPENK